MINCPDCNKPNDIKQDGKHKCKKCLQFIEVKNLKPIRCIPKELI